MLFRLRRKAAQWRFNHSVRAILDTPPLDCNPHGRVTLVTQIHSPDLMMYLLAAKTFARFVAPKNVIVVGDRLSPAEKDVIRAHVQPVQILDIDQVDTVDLPRGGTWERLVTIIRQTSTDYTIQLDADTITLGAPDEVLRCVADNRSFTLGTAMGRSVVSVEQASAAVRHLSGKNSHVQIEAELALHALEPKPASYVRGNSAFAGFALGAHSLDALSSFSRQMSVLIGRQKWLEWGSEQVASNFLVANAPDPCVLPFERYRYYQPGADLHACRFVHFMGTYRFAAGAYRRAARNYLNRAI